jgi:hypothetical protein
MYFCMASLIDKMQKVQNFAAHLISRCDRDTSISEILKDLYCMASSQIQNHVHNFVTGLQISICDLAPEYISDLLILYIPGRALRSALINNLMVPKTRTL